MLNVDSTDQDAANTALPCDTKGLSSGLYSIPPDDIILEVAYASSPVAIRWAADNPTNIGSWTTEGASGIWLIETPVSNMKIAAYRIVIVWAERGTDAAGMAFC